MDSAVSGSTALAIPSTEGVRCLMSSQVYRMKSSGPFSKTHLENYCESNPMDDWTGHMATNQTRFRLKYECKEISNFSGREHHQLKKLGLNMPPLPVAWPPIPNASGVDTFSCGWCYWFATCYASCCSFVLALSYVDTRPHICTEQSTQVPFSVE